MVASGAVVSTPHRTQVESGVPRGRNAFPRPGPAAVLARPRVGASVPQLPARGRGRGALFPAGQRPRPRAGGGPGRPRRAAGVHFLGGAARRRGLTPGSGSAMDPRGSRSRGNGRALSQYEGDGELRTKDFQVISSKARETNSVKADLF